MANANILRGNWQQLKGQVQKRWGKLTNDDLAQIEGDRTILAGKIQERYGHARDAAEREIRDWEENVYA